VNDFVFFSFLRNQKAYFAQIWEEDPRILLILMSKYFCKDTGGFLGIAKHISHDLLA
jgi:hypothetical protein